jgi:hypothetical protein
MCIVFRIEATETLRLDQHLVPSLVSPFGVLKYSAEGKKAIFLGLMPYPLQFSVLLDPDAFLQDAIVAVPAFAHQGMHRTALSFLEEAAMVSIFPFLRAGRTSVVAAATAIGGRYGPSFFSVADALIFFEAAYVIVNEYFSSFFVEFFVFRFDCLLGHGILTEQERKAAKFHFRIGMDANLRILSSSVIYPQGAG